MEAKRPEQKARQEEPRTTRETTTTTRTRETITVRGEATERILKERRERAIQDEMARIKGTEARADHAALKREIEEMGLDRAGEFLLNHRNTIRANAVDLDRFAKAGPHAKLDQLI